MANENEAIQAAMSLATQANHFDLEHDFCNALKLYQASIEKLMPLVESQEIP